MNLHVYVVPRLQDPKNIKALYRRASGAMGSNDFDVAVKDCKRILELDPNNKDDVRPGTMPCLCNARSPKKARCCTHTRTHVGL